MPGTAENCCPAAGKLRAYLVDITTQSPDDAGLPSVAHRGVWEHSLMVHMKHRLRLQPGRKAAQEPHPSHVEHMSMWSTWVSVSHQAQNAPPLLPCRAPAALLPFNECDQAGTGLQAAKNIVS